MKDKDMQDIKDLFYDYGQAIDGAFSSRANVLKQLYAKLKEIQAEHKEEINKAVIETIMKQTILMSLIK